MKRSVGRRVVDLRQDLFGGRLECLHPALHLPRHSQKFFRLRLALTQRADKVFEHLQSRNTVAQA